MNTKAPTVREHRRSVADTYCGGVSVTKPRTPGSRKHGTPEARFARYFTPGSPDECWLWTGSQKSNGYGQFGFDSTRRSTYAHRVAWEFARGPIPDGLTVDHLCRVRHCVNPSHMELVTSEENYQRAVQSWTLCRNGLHPNTEEFTFVGRSGVRRCLPCRQATAQASQKRRAEADRIRREYVDRRVKLSDEQVRELRRRRDAGETVTAMAVEYGISPKTADAIVNRRKRRSVA